MNNDAINRAVAESLGIQIRFFRFWYNGHDNAKPYRTFKTREKAELARTEDEKWGVGPVEEFIDPLASPNFCESLDACAEFEATLTDEAFMDYANLIRRLSYSEEPRRPMLRRQMSAKALIRCKAYLKMKHLWTEQPAPSGANENK